MALALAMRQSTSDYELVSRLPSPYFINASDSGGTSSRAFALVGDWTFQGTIKHHSGYGNLGAWAAMSEWTFQPGWRVKFVGDYKAPTNAYLYIQVRHKWYSMAENYFGGSVTAIQDLSAAESADQVSATAPPAFVSAGLPSATPVDDQTSWRVRENTLVASGPIEYINGEYVADVRFALHGYMTHSYQTQVSYGPRLVKTEQVLQVQPLLCNGHDLGQTPW